MRLAVPGWMRITSSVLAIALAGCAVDSESSPPDEAQSPDGDLTPVVRRELRGLSPHDGIVQRAHVPPIDGLEHVRYRQTYRGVPVAHGNVAVTLIQGAIRHVSDGTLKGIDLDVTPAMSQGDAVTRALADFAHPDAAARAELVIDTDFERRVTRTRLASTPLNADEVARVPVRHVLVWHVLVGDGRESMAYVFDARSGALRAKTDPSSSANRTVWATSEYHGAQMIDVVDNGSACGGPFVMEDWKRGHSYFALMGSNTTFFDSNGSFGDGNPPTADYSSGAVLCDQRAGSANAQTAGVDAEIGLAATWDMYKNVFGLAGWGGNNEAAAIFLHWQEENSRYVTDPFGDFIKLGDGDWQHGGTPRTTIDDVGHEFTHGVDHHVGTIGVWSGANVISEGIADLGGVFAKLYFNDGGFQNGAGVITDTGNQDDFEMFHDILDANGHEHLRFLDRPSLDSHPSPNAWFEDIGDLDPHQSSGPLRRAFYYLMKGASPHDDWNFNRNRAWHSNTPLLPWGMAGIGVNKTAKLYFHTFFGCMSDAEFDQARSCANLMALLLFPSDPSIAAATQNAFGGVNVGNVASTYPSGPAAFFEQEPNDSATQATTGLHWTASPAGFENIFKMDVIGFITTFTDVDEYKFTAKCGRHLGALLQQPFAADQFALSIRLFIQDPTTGNWRAMTDFSNPATVDAFLGVDTGNFCTGTDQQTFLLKVVSNGDAGPFPYIVHLDAQ
jgi:Zn-dependent metalloprotease